MRVLLALFLLAASLLAQAEERLVPLLKDKDRGVRYAAVMALGKAGVGEKALAEALRDPEWCVRAEAAVALARVGPRALPLVLEAARDPDREVRLESWTALRKLGPDAIRAAHDTLRKALSAADAEERLEAARCLVLLGPEENGALLPVVFAALEDEEDPDLLCRAAWVLRSIGPPGAKAAPMLDAWLADKRWSSCDAFRAALEAIRPETPAAVPAPTEAEAREMLAREALGDILDGAVGLEKLGIDPRPLLAERDDEAAARVFAILGPGSTPPPERWLWNGCGEWAAVAMGQRGLAADALVGNNPRVRAAAVWSHGRAGIAVPEALRDEDPVVREMAVRTLGPRELSAALLGDDVAIRRLAANRCAEEGIYVAELLGAARSEDLDTRILATRALSRCGKPFAPALRDMSRAVRMEAVLGLAARHEEELVRALADEDWRIRRAALQRLGPSKGAAEAAAAFLGDLNPLLSEAAADALSRMGADAVFPLERVIPGNRAVQHHAPRVFRAIGADGAPALPVLLLMLTDRDVNVRECAARCLAGIGPGARDASKALVDALKDPRLCVVSNAALALGAIGVTPELERALEDPRARVRAYAAFAYGWACGAARGLDQVPFEVRLPVLDCGEAPPGRFPALRSKDPEIAIPCAAARDAEELDAWECERVMELLLCGGCRPGAPGNFDARFRDVLGSAELPAQMQYLVRARRTDCGKEHVFGENHRIARSENIPAFLWFERTEDADALNGVGGVYMPFSSTYDVSLYVPEEGGRRGPGIPPALRAWLKGKGRIEPSCAYWWLDDVTPLDSDVPDLLAYANRVLGPDGDLLDRCAALRALGKVRDAASERLLREVQVRDGDLDPVATASLARRGDPGAIADLLSGAEFSLLLEAAPGFAVARIRERLLDPDRTAEACRIVAGELDRSYYGQQLGETLFRGLAEAAVASELNSHALARIAVTVPGCRRKALAEAAFSRIDPKDWIPEDEEEEVVPDLEAAGFLYSADPERFLGILRTWSVDPRERVQALTLPMLLQIGDPRSAKRLIAATAGWQDYETLARTRAPEIERFLTEQTLAGVEGASAGLYAYYGLSGVRPGVDETAEDEEAAIVASLKGDPVAGALAALDREDGHSFAPELGLIDDPRVREWLGKQRRIHKFYMTSILSALVLAGDREATEELWSMVRCGRHRLLYGSFDERVFTLGWDFSTLPHWIRELDSNCCRVAGGLESLFEDKLDGADLYQRPWSGIGEPRSRRARIELLRHGGEFIWSPLVDHFVAKPD